MHGQRNCREDDAFPRVCSADRKDLERIGKDHQENDARKKHGEGYDDKIHDGHDIVKQLSVSQCRDHTDGYGYQDTDEQGSAGQLYRIAQAVGYQIRHFPYRGPCHGILVGHSRIQPDQRPHIYHKLGPYGLIEPPLFLNGFDLFIRGVLASQHRSRITRHHPKQQEDKDNNYDYRQHTAQQSFYDHRCHIRPSFRCKKAAASRKVMIPPRF